SPPTGCPTTWAPCRCCRGRCRRRSARRARSSRSTTSSARACRTCTPTSCRAPRATACAGSSGRAPPTTRARPPAPPSGSARSSRSSALPDEPAADLLDPLLDLLHRRRRDLAAAAVLPQPRVQHPARGPGTARPGRHQLVALLAQLRQPAVVDGGARRLRARRPRHVLGLPLPQQRRDLVGVEQTRQAEEVELLVRPDVAAHTELAAVEEHLVEAGVRLERLEAGEQ